MRVTIIGPNLRQADERRGTFHVHAAGCADIARTLTRNGLGEYDAWTAEASSRAEVGEEIYGDHIAEGSMTTDDAVADCYFAPCVALTDESDRIHPRMDNPRYDQ
jgi:hypothetical protein